MEGIWERMEKELNQAVTSFWRNYRRDGEATDMQDRQLDGHSRSDLARDVQERHLSA